MTQEDLVGLVTVNSSALGRANSTLEEVMKEIYALQKVVGVGNEGEK